MDRICPKCGYELYKSSSFFCANCGERLSEELISIPDTVRVKKYVPSDTLSDSKENPKRLKKFRFTKAFYLTSVSIVVILVSFITIFKSGVFTLILKTTSLGSKIDSTVEKISTSPAKQNPHLSLHLQFESQPFEKLSLANYVPSDVSFYFEGTNLHDVLDLDLFANPDDELLRAGKVLLEPNFSGFAYKVDDNVVWGFIFRPKDSGLAQDVFADKVTDKWKIAFINDYMIVSTDVDLFDEIKSVESNLSHSLSKDPEFVTMQKDLETSGQFRIFFFTSEAREIVRGSLEGLTQKAISNINEVLNSRYNSLVISNTYE